jgi:hypothetical protein
LILEVVDCEGEEVEDFGRERRAQATAWLAPFPPDPVEKDEAVKVSPPDGTRGVTVTRSVLREPIMVMIFGAILKLGGGVEGERWLM